MSGRGGSALVAVLSGDLKLDHPQRHSLASLLERIRLLRASTESMLSKTMYISPAGMLGRDGLSTPGTLGIRGDIS